LTDNLFKENNITFTGTGFHDIFLGFLPLILLGASHKVERIRGFIQFNVDDYGNNLSEAHGVGLSLEDFSKTIARSDAPSLVCNTNEWLAASLGWKILKTTQAIYPMINDEVDREIYSKLYDNKISFGYSTGMKVVVETVCENGIIIETTMIGALYHGNMHDVISWSIEGEPSTEIVINHPSTAELTCASTINRLNQVYDSKSGYVPTYQLGLIAYK